MNIKELKERIGSQAEHIIASGLNLQKSGSKYKGQCPLGGHSKDNPTYEWKHDHFFCYDCHKGYDIVDFYKATAGSDWYEELHKLAGIEFFRPELKTITPITKEQNASGVEYLKSRGISKKIMDLYRVRCDNEWLYFNYATPDNKLVSTKWRKIKEKVFNATTGGSSILYGMHLLDKQTTLIICEGEIDALTLAEIGSKNLDSFLFSSLPQGAQSLDKVYENCRQWLDMFENIVIIPDKDKAGDKFREKAMFLLGEYNLSECILPCKDVNDYYMNADYNPEDIFKLIKPLLPKLTFSVSTKEKGRDLNYKAYQSGYVTLDYNFAGLQEGWLTVLAGRKNDGKTTFTRQILLAMAKQKIKSFMFIGEDRWENDRNKLARLAFGHNGGVGLRANTPAGAKRWDATEEAIDKFRGLYGEFIQMADMTQVKNKDAYDELYSELRKLVRHGYKLFVIDSLMKMTINPKKGMTKWQMQEKVVNDLKFFVDAYRVHVILIAHTNKGGVDISGVEEIGNLADGIINFKRMTDETTKPDIKIPDDIKDRVCAYATIGKARDDGGYRPLFFEWCKERGALINLSTQPEAIEYENAGYWTKSIHRMNEGDLPNDYQNHKALNAYVKED